jgi:hypothetical protein
VIWQLIVGLGASLGLGFAFGPLDAFILIATVVTAVIILIYIAVNVACTVFYLRDRRTDFNWFRHLVVPVVGTLFFIPAWLTAMGFAVFDFVSPLAYPYSLAGPIVAVILATGLIYLIVLYAIDRQRISDTARVFVEEEPPQSAPAVPVG